MKMHERNAFNAILQALADGITGGNCEEIKSLLYAGVSHPLVCRLLPVPGKFCAAPTVKSIDILLVRITDWLRPTTLCM